MAEHARVCAYDRAGMGWSEPGPGAPDATQTTAELHALLQEAGEEGSYVLVGHSLAGLYSRVYADRYPGCVVGSVVEERYERLDDGSEAYSAHLKKIWRSAWGTEDRVSTVLSHDGGIHRMGNFGGGAAISVHLYGPRVGEVDGRDYDPSRNYVCDRLEI